MGLLSSTVSVTRYKVKGKIESPVLEKVSEGLSKNAIREIDNDNQEKAIGWTSFEKPYAPDFEGSSFNIGAFLVFSMRIDKKSIPAKVITKYYHIEMAKRLAETGREYLSRNEKRSLKEHVINVLSLRIPATPNIYDVVWNVEESWLWFFSNQKSANEELETLFTRSFNISLIRIFPFTAAHLAAGLSEADLDVLSQLTPTKFTE